MQVEQSVTQLQHELDHARETLRALETRLAAMEADDDRARQADTLKAFAAGVYAAKGDAFFSLLAQALAEALQLDRVCIARLDHDGAPRVRSLAVIAGGVLLDNLDYPLAGTPCERVLHGEVCAYASRVQAAFPMHQDLVSMNVDGYVGVPLFSADGRVLGLIAAMHGGPVVDVAYVVSLLQLSAKSIQAELERRLAQEELVRHAAELEYAYARLRERNAVNEQEIAERTRELASEKAQMEVMITHIPVAMVFLDCDLVIRWASPSVPSLLGIAPEHLLNRPLGELSPLDVKPDGLFQQVLASRKPRQLSAVGMPFSQLGLEVGYWDITYVPTLAPDGTLLGVLVMGNEVTSRVEYEQFQNNRITQLEDLDQLKRDFVNTISHELRTPLTSIMGFAEFLEDGVEGPLTPGQGEFVACILDGARRLRGIVDDLLDFSRLEAGALSLHRCRQDVLEVLPEVVASLVPQAQEAGITLDTQWPEGPLVADADHRRLGQVLLNLVANAIKFTRSGGTVTVRLTEEPGGFRVVVQDTGIGIARTHLPQLFDKFYQVDPSTTREHGGTGLGLAIARALVVAHGGAIGVESEPGVGTTFWFTVPNRLSEPGA